MEYKYMVKGSIKADSKHDAIETIYYALDSYGIEYSVIEVDNIRQVKK